MKWPQWSLRTPDPNDFLPVLIGCIMLFVSLPGFLGVLFYPDRNAGVLAVALLVVLGGGMLLGAGFLVFGIRNTAYPGSLAYRITHARIFFR
ncbi:MAG TPA: hypothetical protein VJR70_02920 [Stellaceae bacterium]|nr:hypothetical protein [Stellaceae bacterium]